MGKIVKLVLVTVDEIAVPNADIITGTCQNDEIKLNYTCSVLLTTSLPAQRNLFHFT